VEVVEDQPPRLELVVAEERSPRQRKLKLYRRWEPIVMVKKAEDFRGEFLAPESWNFLSQERLTSSWISNHFCV
jgi:hypothetical protein